MPSKNKEREAAKDKFFKQGGGLVKDKNHMHFFSIHGETAHVYEIGFSPSAKGEYTTQQSKETISSEEAFNLYWILCNQNNPKNLLLATASCLLARNHPDLESDSDETLTSVGPSV
ncbi:hypothetical protein [Legionella sp. W05-934-2]|uniref:hypothetical protein n=1 Tax=Legionella sp. W05-934-2 TaxID=1198649 RepID=UPI0034624CB4